MGAKIARVISAYFLRRAKYVREFLDWAESRKHRNPETGQEVQFQSLPSSEQARIHDAWARSQQAQQPQTQQTRDDEDDTPQRARRDRERQEAARRAREAALHGKIVKTRPLSAGYDPEDPDASVPGVNASELVVLEHDGQQSLFIRKPAKGEVYGARHGIPAGTYHMREQAAYDLDSLLGGQGIVPVTATRGSSDGSYQQWSKGARAMFGEDLDKLAAKVSPEELADSPDFARLNLLDLILGHEDRHNGNLLWYFDGDETPENLRFVAIDNGLSLAGESPQHLYIHPFDNLYVEDPKLDLRKEQVVKKEYQQRGDWAVGNSLVDIPEDLRDRLDDLDLDEVAETLVKSGINDEAAVRSALVRIAALQHDPEVFQSFLAGADSADRPLMKAWSDFQAMSREGDDLLERAGASADDVNAALERARPKGGWVEPPHDERPREDNWDDWGEWNEEDEEKKTNKEPPAGDAPTLRER